MSRAGGVTLEQLMALTITDDHAAQEAAFYGAPEWQRSPSKLRERLTEREIDASHALVRFVGLDTYRQAGGGVRRDLFAEVDAGTMAMGSTRSRISLSAMLTRYVALPPLDEQASIQGWLRQQTEQLDALRAEGERAIQLLNERRSALISAAVTGQIDVRNLVPSEVA